MIEKRAPWQSGYKMTLSIHSARLICDTQHKWLSIKNSQYAEFHYAEYHVSFIVMLNAVMLSVLYAECRGTEKSVQIFMAIEKPS